MPDIKPDSNSRAVRMAEILPEEEPDKERAAYYDVLGESQGNSSGKKACV